MISDLEKSSLSARHDHLARVLSGERFLKMQGLGKEVPFFICPFPTEESREMNRFVSQLVNTLDQLSISVLQVNLFDLCVSIIKKRNRWTKILSIEESNPKGKFFEQLQNYLDTQTHLIPALDDILSSSRFDILFITGVGEVYPFVRSHNVLNNLQRIAKSKPTVMFFPGQFTHSPELGASLDLFGRLHEDNYYRAFNLFTFEV